MVAIDELVELGLNCPNCKGTRIRGGYHDWQMMDSFICENCGLHWNEDFKELVKQNWRYGERGFIWVMCDAEHPLIPILNSGSADGGTPRTNFVKKGISRGKKGIGRY